MHLGVCGDGERWFAPTTPMPVLLVLVPWELMAMVALMPWLAELVPKQLFAVLQAGAVTRRCNLTFIIFSKPDCLAGTACWRVTFYTESSPKGNLKL